MKLRKTLVLQSALLTIVTIGTVCAQQTTTVQTDSTGTVLTAPSAPMSKAEMKAQKKQQKKEEKAANAKAKAAKSDAKAKKAQDAAMQAQEKAKDSEEQAREKTHDPMVQEPGVHDSATPTPENATPGTTTTTTTTTAPKY